MLAGKEKQTRNGRKTEAEATAVKNGRVGVNEDERSKLLAGVRLFERSRNELSECLNLAEAPKKGEFKSRANRVGSRRSSKMGLR